VRLLLGASLAACSLLPLASAVAGDDHACCPVAAPSDSGDCCLRATVPGQVDVAAPDLSGVAWISRAPTPVLTSFVATRLDSASLSRPADPYVPSRSSRAPPSLLA
jgi:hypothetical protein